MLPVALEICKTGLEQSPQLQHADFLAGTCKFESHSFVASTFSGRVLDNAIVSVHLSRSKRKHVNDRSSCRSI